MPIKDLVVSGLIIFIMSIIIANIYDPFLGLIYAFGNILTLTFLSWLYQETWSDPSKWNSLREKINIKSYFCDVNFEEYFKFTMYEATKDSIKKNNKLSKVDGDIIIIFNKIILF